MIKPERRWQWAAFGKHPAARDYFRLGQSFPLMGRFSEWIEQGYSSLTLSNRVSSASQAWRFWTREARRENVVCGIMRESRDGLGRPYPLLTMGSGPLPGWEREWPLVSLVLDSTWAQLEYLSTRRVEDLKGLEEDLQSVKPPSVEWGDLLKKKDALAVIEPLVAREWEQQAAERPDRVEHVFSLDHGASLDYADLICAHHAMLRTRTGTLPTVVFMGGTIERSFLALFRRPLAPSDYARLWLLAADGARC
jgi:type VI secretion system protein VasJ